jgi:hypothetical protein
MLILSVLTVLYDVESIPVANSAMSHNEKRLGNFHCFTLL